MLFSIYSFSNFLDEIINITCNFGFKTFLQLKFIMNDYMACRIQFPLQWASIDHKTEKPYSRNLFTVYRGYII
jgi:hypothetical protein